ncbi:hypothetical protein SALBM135S_01059 [Streptomyces alboniger]
MACTRDHSFLHKKLAYNHRMTAMQGAVALAQVGARHAPGRNHTHRAGTTEPCNHGPGIGLMPGTPLKPDTHRDHR